MIVWGTLYKIKNEDVRDVTGNQVHAVCSENQTKWENNATFKVENIHNGWKRSEFQNLRIVHDSILRWPNGIRVQQNVTTTVDFTNSNLDIVEKNFHACFTNPSDVQRETDSKDVIVIHQIWKVARFELFWISENLINSKNATNMLDIQVHERLIESIHVTFPVSFLIYPNHHCPSVFCDRA